MAQETEEIKIPDIEKELSQLWEKQKIANLKRACLFNLLIFNKNPSRMDYLKEIAKGTMSKFPSRVIFIKQDCNPEANHLRVTVSIEVMGKGEASIACEHILIDVSTSQLKRVPFVITPNLVADLPLYLLWGQDPTSEKVILPYFQAYASRIIFDSDCAENLQQFSNNMLKLMDEVPKVDFLDLNWVRISGWREVLKQVLDSAQAIEHLNKAKLIQISFNNKKADFAKHREIQALYFTSWIVNQMHWTITSDVAEGDIRYIRCSSGANEILFSLNPVMREEYNPGAITEVQLATGDDHFYLMTPHDNLPKAVVHISSLETCELPFSIALPGIRCGSVFTTELVYSPLSAQYKGILKLLSKEL